MDAANQHATAPVEDPADIKSHSVPARPSDADTAFESRTCSASYPPALRNFFYSEFRDWAAEKKGRGEAITDADLAKFAFLLYTANYQSNGIPTVMTNGSGSEKGGLAQSRLDYREGGIYKADAFASFAKRVASFKFEEDSSFGIFKVPQFLLSRGAKSLNVIRQELKANPTAMVQRCNSSALYSAEQLRGLTAALSESGENSLMGCNLSNARCLALWSAACPRVNMSIFVDSPIPVKYFSKDIQNKEAQIKADLRTAPCASVFKNIAGEPIQQVRRALPKYEYPPGQGPTQAQVNDAKPDPRLKFASPPEAPPEKKPWWRRIFSSTPTKSTDSHAAQGPGPKARNPGLAGPSRGSQMGAPGSSTPIPSPPPAPFQQKAKSDHAAGREDDPASDTAPARPPVQMDSRYDPRPGEVAPEVRALRMSRQLPTRDIAMADLPKKFSSEAEKAKYLNFLKAPSEVDRSNWKTKDFAPALVANLEYIHQNGAQIVGARGWDTRIGSCYKYIKWALKRSGVVKGYLPGVSAIDAHEDGILKNAGFTDLKALGYTVATAPVGSIIVYHGGKKQRLREGAEKKDGDIGIKTDYGVVSDYSKSGDGLGWPVAAIYARI